MYTKEHACIILMSIFIYIVWLDVSKGIKQVGRAGQYGPLITQPVGSRVKHGMDCWISYTTWYDLIALIDGTTPRPWYVKGQAGPACEFLTQSDNFLFCYLIKVHYSCKLFMRTCLQHWITKNKNILKVSTKSMV